MKITREKWHLDLFDYIKYIFREIKDFIFYKFNKEKVNKKLLEHKKYSDSLEGIGIKKEIKKYHVIKMAEDFASFKNYNSLEEYLKAPLGDIKALKNLGISV